MPTDKTVFPAPLRKGDKIAICSPAGKIDSKTVHAAADILRQQGWQVEIMPHALGASGSYSGTAAERYSDLRAAFSDPSVRAILCARGGYGVVHILEQLNDLPIEDDPKWIIGYSDISALHALMAKKGIASIHSPMCSAIQKGPEDPDNATLFDILRGERPVHIFEPHVYDRPGMATGTLRGGNLAVLAELIDTPYDILEPDTILFIEDVSEPIYKIERILYQLRMNGVLKNLKGLIVGKFTEYKPDDNHADMESMIRDMVAPYSYPVAFGVPVGHVDHNLPMIESAKVTLKVNPYSSNSIIFHR